MSSSAIEPDSMTLAVHGAQRMGDAVSDDLDGLRAALRHLPDDQAGVRISGNDALRPFLLGHGSIGSVATEVLGPSARPVRAIVFDKTAETNWSLAWHQDRTICVRNRVAIDGFGPWTIKGGMQHVAPPFDLLTRMITLRVHLDDVPATNAPLLVAPGSHLAGRIAVDDVADVVRRHGVATCIAEAGDIWVYSTPILHASEAAANPARRRVLQLDFAAEALPGALEWLGV